MSEEEILELTITDLKQQDRQTLVSKLAIDKLAKNIQKEGLQNHVIVTDEGIVIEGLARIEALKRLKVTTVPAFVSGDFAVLCYEVSRQRGDNPMEMPRILDMIADLERARKTFMRRRRRWSGTHKTKMPGLGSGMQIREILHVATGLSIGRLDKAIQYGAQAQIDPTIRELWETVRRGDQTLYGMDLAVAKLRKPEEDPLGTAEEVRAVMERGLRTLTTTIEAMSKFGSASVLTLRERIELSKQVEKRRSAIASLNRKIRDGMQREVEEARSEH